MSPVDQAISPTDLERAAQNRRRTLATAIARVTYDANRAYADLIGNAPKPAWEDAPALIRDSVINGVMDLMNGAPPNPGASHERWLAYKQREGWTVGPEINAVDKTHPNLLPFTELPIAEQVKDHLFLAIATTLISFPDAITPAGGPSS